ncbi:Plasmodium exported protein (hyp6), unknown, putative [Plasmodium sp. gorilla clade G3]|nr:Plasmodium exported protein (hyp6), unknown, putative [Plasmodium sp. gorilla clade G3]
MVPYLIIKRTLTEMIMYNNNSQLNVPKINNNTDEYEENGIFTSLKQFLKTSKKEPNNRKSENNNNYNITKKEETLEDLLKEYQEEMKEINKRKKKSFFKRAKLVLEVFDNIFIDKVIDSNIQNKQSELKEDVIDNSVILCASPILAIPIISYFCKRMDFFDLPK